MAFLEERAEKPEEAPVVKDPNRLTAQQYRDLYLYLSEVLILERDPKANKAKKTTEIVERYVTQLEIFPESLRESLVEKVNQSERLNADDPAVFFAGTNHYAYEMLEQMYIEYQKTKSYRTLKQQLRVNEDYYYRLSLFGMI